MNTLLLMKPKNLEEYISATYVAGMSMSHITQLSTKSTLKYTLRSNTLVRTKHFINNGKVFCIDKLCKMNETATSCV